MSFPEFRFRRLRDNAVLCEMVAETTLSARHLVQPLFVKEGLDGRRPIDSMPGQAQLSLDELVAEAARALGLYDAMNLDGGASSGLWCDGRYLVTPGREISNALVVLKGKAD